MDKSNMAQSNSELAEAKTKLAWYESHQTTAQCDLKKSIEEIAFLQQQLAAVTEELKSRSKERIEALNQVREYQKEFHILSQQCARFSSL